VTGNTDFFINFAACLHPVSRSFPLTGKRIKIWFAGLPGFFRKFMFIDDRLIQRKK
jgi:hypothetical protein